MEGKLPKVFNPGFGPEKKPRKKIYLYVIFLLAAGAGIGYFLFYSSFFNIKTVKTNAADQAINDTFQQLVGENILKINSKQIQNKIQAAFPKVKELKIRRGLPETLVITLTEREPKLIWQTNDKNYLLDSHGEVFVEVSEADALSQYPIIKDNKDIAVEIGQKVLAEKFLQFFDDLQQNFYPKTNINVQRYEINETTFEIEAVTDQGWRVLFDPTRTVASQLDDLSQFLKDHKNEVTKYIDVRIEGKIYYL